MFIADGVVFKKICIQFNFNFRCGMIYMDPLQLGWQPLVKSWMVQSLPDKLTPEQRDTIRVPYSTFLAPCALNFFRVTANFLSKFYFF